MLTAITCTGSRPEAFSLCVSYMKRQTTKEDIQWIVVCDDYDPSQLALLLKGLPKNIKPELYQGPITWKEGLNTHKGNMLEALKHVEGDKIFFFEDDDFYAPNYLEEMSKVLEFVEIAGEANAKYYNLNYPGFRRMQNYSHASLCQTGIRASMLPDFLLAVESGNDFFDIELWKGAHRQSKKCAMFCDLNLCIGIKGMPGRQGIGVGHKVEGYALDSRLDILKRWLGGDVGPYLSFARGLTHAANTKRKKDPKTDAKNVQQKESRAGVLRNDKRGKDKGSGKAPVEFIPTGK